MIKRNLDDHTLEWAAREIEAADILDLRGISGRKKRDREDAELRRKTRSDLRKEMAAHLRAFMSRDDLSPRAILEHIRDSDEREHVRMLSDAWPLAWDRLVTITAHLNLADNCIPPATAYRIEITEKGHALLASPLPSPLKDETEAKTSISRISS